MGHVRYKLQFLSLRGQTKFMNFQIIHRLCETNGAHRESRQNSRRVELMQSGVISQMYLTFRDATISTQEKKNDKGSNHGSHFIQQTHSFGQGLLAGTLQQEGCPRPSLCTAPPFTLVCREHRHFLCAPDPERLGNTAWRENEDLGDVTVRLFG